MDRYTTLEAEARCEREQRPRWRDRWLSPLMEFGRRFLWKGGMLDGPEGWAFCALSGLSKWVEADKHRRMWRIANGHAVYRTMREHPQRRAQRAAPNPQMANAPAREALPQLPPSLRPLLQEANARE
jgi:hypothetical protein